MKSSRGLLALAFSLLAVGYVILGVIGCQKLIQFWRTTRPQLKQYLEQLTQSW